MHHLGSRCRHTLDIALINGNVLHDHNQSLTIPALDGARAEEFGWVRHGIAGPGLVLEEYHIAVVLPIQGECQQIQDQYGHTFNGSHTISAFENIQLPTLSRRTPRTQRCNSSGFELPLRSVPYLARTPLCGYRF